jgi:hypothetical protein
MLARFGVDLSRSTLCDWLAQSAALLRPLWELLRARVLQSRVVKTDDTPVQVQAQAGAAAHQGRLWAVQAVTLAGPSRFWPGPGFITKVVRRTFNATELDALKDSLGQHKDPARSAQAQLPEILRLRRDGKSLSAIGHLLGFSHQAVGRVLSRRGMDATFR